MNITEIVGKHKALDIFFSSKCNMNCSYCYIPKTEGLNKINNDITNAIDSGTMIKSIIDSCDKESLEQIGLWGAEPTINSGYLDKFLSDLFTEFKEIGQVNFSTNALLGEGPIMEMIHAMDKNISKLSRPDRFSADIQISLDGPAWITDASRHPGATEKIISTYRNLLKAISESEFISLKNVSIHFKPTLDLVAMKEMNNEPKKYEEWFLFFEELYDMYEDIPDSEKGALEGRVFVALPTAVTPGYHTTGDGVEFAKFIDLSTKICRDKFRYYKRKYLFTQPANSLKEHLFINSTVAAQSATLTCGGGDATFAIDHTQKLYPCHRSFGINHYMNSSPITKTLSQSMVANSNNDTEKIRLNYIMRGVHDFPFTRYAYITAAVKTLAMVGQADKIYLTDDNMCTLLAIAMNSTYCHAGNVEETTSMHALMLSQIRLYANGALQEILKLLKDDWRL